MTKSWIRYTQLSLGALALSMASLAGAQTPAPAESAQPPAAPQAEHPKPKHKHHGHKKHHHRHAYDRTDPVQREAAAARDQARRGGLRRHESMDQYQRNALARCEVFKTPEDRHACAERVRQPGQGSVEGGGIIREYTQEVRVPQ